MKVHLKVHTGKAVRLYALREEVLREEICQDTPAENAHDSCIEYSDM
jgi:hypothetical protein